MADEALTIATHNTTAKTMSGDTVEIRAFEDGARLVVQVADTGSGIPEEELRYVWDELFRGQGARGVPGSGLGLALVQAIAEAAREARRGMGFGA